MQKYHGNFQTTTGAAIVNGTVRVYLAGTASLATLYQDNEVTTISQPLSTGSLGEVAFKAADGDYDMVLDAGVGYEGKTITHIHLEDYVPIPSTLTQSADLSNTTDTAKGDALVGVKRTETGAVARTQHDKNLEFMTQADFDSAANFTAAGGFGVTLPKIGFNTLRNGIRLGVNYTAPTDRIARFSANSAYSEDLGLQSTVLIERVFNANEGGITNPYSLHVSAHNDAATTMGSIWALASAMNVNASCDGAVAVSMTTNKNVSQGGLFAGHINAKDNVTYNNRSSATAIVGAEVDVNGIGMDASIPNSGLGTRFAFDIQGRTSPNATPTWPVWAATTAYSLGDQRVPVGTVLTPGYTGFYFEVTTAGTSGGSEPAWVSTVGATTNDGSVVWTARRGAELGCGIRITNHDEQSYGWFRTGLALNDDLTNMNPNTMTTAIHIRTAGVYGIRVNSKAHTTADISLESDSSYGLSATGSYTNGAIRIGTDQYFVWRTLGTVKSRFNTSTNRIEFDNSGTLRAEIEIDATPGLLFNGTQVLAARRTGWTDQTAAASRADLGGSPTVGALASFCRALYDDLKAHGIIGN